LLLLGEGAEASVVSAGVLVVNCGAVRSLGTGLEASSLLLLALPLFCWLASLPSLPLLELSLSLLKSSFLSSLFERLPLLLPLLSLPLRTARLFSVAASVLAMSLS
jgi:hypothetical protein